MTEYIIVVALIAVAAIGTFTMFGNVVRDQSAAMAMELGGFSGQEANVKAGKAGDQAGDIAIKNEGGLNKFTRTANSSVGK